MSTETASKTTVVVPFYNDSAEIQPTLEALGKQTLKPAMVLISDDASSAEEWRAMEELSKSYPDLNLKLLRSEVNTGPGKARERAILQTETPYIAFCDADDLFLPDRIEKSEALLDQHGGFVWSGSFRELDGKRSPMDRSKAFGGQEPIEAYIVAGRINKFTSTISAETTTLQKMIFRADLKYYENFFTLLQGYKLGKVQYIEEPLSVKVDRSTSYSNARKGSVLIKKVRARLWLNVLLAKVGYSWGNLLKWNFMRLTGQL